MLILVGFHALKALNTIVKCKGSRGEREISRFSDKWCGPTSVFIPVTDQHVVSESTTKREFLEGRTDFPSGHIDNSVLCSLRLYRTLYYTIILACKKTVRGVKHRDKKMACRSVYNNEHQNIAQTIQTISFYHQN